MQHSKLREPELEIVTNCPRAIAFTEIGLMGSASLSTMMAQSVAALSGFQSLGLVFGRSAEPNCGPLSSSILRVAAEDARAIAAEKTHVSRC